jgi:hypothetical protein
MRSFGVAAWLALLSLGGIARAQEPTGADIERARALFVQGVEATRAERWEAARIAFERSLAIVDLPNTRLNLASAQAHTGRLVAAVENYRRFLTEATGAAERFRADAEAALAAVEPRIPRLRLRLRGLLPSDRLEVDGRALSREEAASAVPLDPGQHTVDVVRDGAVVARATFPLEEGVEREMPVAVLPRPATAPAPGDEDDDRDGRPLRRSPWLWTGVGAAVVAGVVTGVVLATRGGPGYYDGTLGSGQVRFR